MNEPSRILVCGGRNFFDYNRLEFIMETQVRPHLSPEFCIIHGGAVGADSMVGKYARNMGVAEIRVDAQWKFYGNRAGSIRNIWMLNWCRPEVVIAFPGGVGTRHMIKTAREWKIPVYEVPSAQ